MGIEPMAIPNEYDECKIHCNISQRLNPNTLMQHQWNINTAYKGLTVKLVKCFQQDVLINASVQSQITKTDIN